MNDVVILSTGDAMDSQPKLHQMRETMPEPSKVDLHTYRTVEPWEDCVYDPDPDLILKPIKQEPVHEWERVLVTECGVSFYAWQHRETKLILL